MQAMTTEYDFVVIGGGSGGYAAARTALEYGLKTAVIDGAETLGGVCILKGCMPSKALIESANRFRSLRRSREFGLRSGDAPSIRPNEIIARKRELIDDFAGYRQGQLQAGKFDLLRGKARFTSENEIEILPTAEAPESQPEKIQFRSACIATGSEVARIPIPGLEETGYWISDDILDAEELPDSIVVLGGGAIALEMACYLEGLGKQVTVIQRSDQLVSGADRDVALSLQEALTSRENLTVYTGTNLLQVAGDSSGQKTVRFEHGGEEKTVIADEILQALGRKPRVSDLNLEAAGVDLVPAGSHIQCDALMKTSIGHIFAAGDVCGPHEVVHIAIEQGEVAAQNAAVELGLAEKERAISYRLKLLGIFTDPQVAMVGMTEAEARESGLEVHAATYPFDDHGKSMVMGETHGFVKLIAEKDSGRLVGGAVVGPEAVELIHEIVVAMSFNATAADLAVIPHYHPTLSEIWTYPAEDLAG